MSNQNQQRPQNPRPNQMPAVMQESALALPGGRSFMPSDAQWKQIKEMGVAAFKSGMIPLAIKSPEAAAIIGLKAYELGIPLMEGFAHIHVINGKPTISREMMQTLVYQNVQGAVIDILESTSKICRVEGKRPGRKPFQLSFSIEDAKAAGLLAKPGPWQQYPTAMLMNRAISALCRAYFPDGLRGCSYTAEELEPSIPTTGRTLEDEAPVETPMEAEVVQPKPEPQADPGRAAQLRAIVDPAKWPQGSVSEYCQKIWHANYADLSDFKWGMLVNVIKNSSADLAMSEFNASSETRA